MNIADACDFLSSVTVHPDFEMTVEDYTRRFADCIRVTLLLGAYSSNESEAPAFGTCVPGRIPSEWVIAKVSGKSEADLLHDLIVFQMNVMEHEIREFTRYPNGERWVAPFHPHRVDGIDAWSERHPDANDHQYGSTA